MVRLFRRSVGTAARLHPALGSGAAEAARADAVLGDVAAVSRAYSALDRDARSVFLEALSGVLPAPDHHAWTRLDPDTAATWVLRGTSLAHAGFTVRGGDLPERTPSGQLLRFAQTMRDARRVLQRAVELDGTDPGPWSQLLVTGYAEGRDAVLSDLAELRRHAPWDQIGLRLGLDLLGEKWFGRPGEARALAEEVGAQAPLGSEAHVVAAFVIRDEWFHRVVFKKDRAGAQRELTSAASRAAVGAALDRSLRAAEHRPGEGTALVRNQFAHVCSLVGDHDGAREQFAALDGLVTLWPWELFGDPVGLYEETRRRSS